MIHWTIISETQEDIIQIGKCTMLMEHSKKWFSLTRDINEFFNTRSSSIQIMEGMSKVEKTDWDCYFIPYDAHIHLEKITSKSPLLPIVENVIEELKYSPLYYEISELWENWNQEIEFGNHYLDEYELIAELKSFDEIDLKSFIQLKSINRLHSPLDFKLLLLRLINREILTRKTLVILEYPEMFANDQMKKELNNLIEKMINRGIYFLVVTAEEEITGVKNYNYSDKIINEISVMNMKRKLIAEAPFYVDEMIYHQAKTLFMEVVDKVVSKKEFRHLLVGYQQEAQVLLCMMFKELKIDQTLDLSGFPPNIIKFIHAY